MFEEQEAQQATQDETYSYGQGAGKDTELIKWQLTGADLINEIKMRMLGYSWDDLNETWTEQTDPMVSEECINDTISLLNATGINKNTILSTLTEEMVFKLMMQFDSDLSDLIAINHVRYEIEPQKMTLIKDAICNQVYFAMTRAIGGGEKKFIQSTEHREYRFNQPLQPEKKPRTFFGIKLPG